MDSEDMREQIEELEYILQKMGETRKVEVEVIGVEDEDDPDSFYECDWVDVMHNGISAWDYIILDIDGVKVKMNPDIKEVLYLYEFIIPRGNEKIVNDIFLLFTSPNMEEAERILEELLNDYEKAVYYSAVKLWKTNPEKFYNLFTTHDALVFSQTDINRWGRTEGIDIYTIRYKTPEELNLSAPIFLDDVMIADIYLVDIQEGNRYDTFYIAPKNPEEFFRLLDNIFRKYRNPMREAITLLKTERI